MYVSTLGTLETMIWCVVANHIQANAISPIYLATLHGNDTNVFITSSIKYYKYFKIIKVL